MVAVADWVGRSPQKGKGPRLDHFEKVLEKPCPFHGGQAKHLLKDCGTMKKYVTDLDLTKGKGPKLRQKGGDDGARGEGEDSEFPEAEGSLMIFGDPTGHATSPSEGRR